MTKTGFPLSVRVLIIERAQGLCERCGLAKPGMQIHHRRPRGMGGSKRDDTNKASNGLYLCGDCHAWVESNRVMALRHGLLLAQSEHPPETYLWHRTGLVKLCDDGTITLIGIRYG